MAAGLIGASALSGYRNNAVYLRTSRYVPPRWETVRDAMPALFDLLKMRPNPRCARFWAIGCSGSITHIPMATGAWCVIMNAMLASGGFPWTVVRVEDRAEYLDALDRASIDSDIAPFAAFLTRCVGQVVERS